MKSDERIHLSQNLYCLRSELLGPILTIRGACKLLVGKVPETINDMVNRIDLNSEELRLEISSFPKNTIDLHSADNAARQLHSLAAKWENDARNLAFLIKKIETVNVYLDDAELEFFLKEVIANCLQKFEGLILYIKMTKPEHLILDNGFAKVLDSDGLK